MCDHTVQHFLRVHTECYVSLLTNDRNLGKKFNNSWATALQSIAISFGGPSVVLMRKMKFHIRNTIL